MFNCQNLFLLNMFNGNEYNIKMLLMIKLHMINFRVKIWRIPKQGITQIYIFEGGGGGYKTRVCAQIFQILIVLTKQGWQGLFINES